MINYNAIHTALVAVLQAGPSGGYTIAPNTVFQEAMEREVSFSNMPFINVRLSEGITELRSIPNGYYIHVGFEVDIVAFDLSHFSVAATIRDGLLREAQRAVQQNRAFHADIATSTVGPQLKFLAATPEGAQGHVSSVTFVVDVEASVEAT